MEQAAGKNKRHVCIIFVHGINTTTFNFAGKMRTRLEERLPGASDHLHFFPVFWADTVRRHQDAYLTNCRDQTRHKRLRRLVVQGLGDAAAYQKTEDGAHSVYEDVQGKLFAAVKELDRENRHYARGDCALIFIGHSLGSHIISSFVWDLNKLKQQRCAPAGQCNPGVLERWRELKDASPFCRLDTLAGLVSIGSNIPVFTFSFGYQSIYPITMAPPNTDLRPAFPGAALPRELFDKAKWLNFYSARDVLGYPLKSLNDFFRQEPRIEDIRVRSESWLTQWIPYWSCRSAHLSYWTNSIVLNTTAALIRDVIETPIAESPLAVQTNVRRPIDQEIAASPTSPRSGA